MSEEGNAHVTRFTWLPKGPPWLLLFLGFLLIEVAWVLAMPITTAPDEQAHVYRAVSIWRGAVIPSKLNPLPPAVGGWEVRVPGSTRAYAESTACTRFRSVSAQCSESAPSDSELPVTVFTWAGRYFPLYYLAVGWPSLFDSGELGFYLMRIVSGIVTAMSLALAVESALRWTRARVVCIGVLVGVTPTVTWLGAMINPNGWEIAGAVLLWMAGVSSMSAGSTESTTRLNQKIAFGAGLLLLNRLFSPLWFVIVIGSLILFFRRETLRRRFVTLSLWTRLCPMVCLCSCVAWYLFVERASAARMAAPEGPSLAPSEILLKSVENEFTWLRAVYGVFGWLDTPAPLLCFFSWLLVMTVIVGSALYRRDQSRQTLTLLGLMIATAIVPVLLESFYWIDTGRPMWQGRYVLPTFVGIPILASVILHLDASLIGRSLSRHWIKIFSWWAIVTTISFAAALKRYVMGADSLWSLAGLGWKPPISPYWLLLAFISGMFLLSRCLVTHSEWAEYNAAVRQPRR